MTNAPAAGPRGADSEVGRLETVLLHRPGPELKRLTPRNSDELLFDGLPWVARAQDEHDAFAQALRDRGVEVLHLDRLLTDVLDFPAARAELIAAASGRRPAGRSGWPGGCSPAGWRTPCSSSRSRSSGRRCTWTPSPRWSTPTPWSCTRPSRTPCAPGPSP